MVMKGRDKNFAMAWVWPSHLMDVTAPDSDFMRVYDEFKADGLLAVATGGMAAFSVPTSNKKPGTGDTGAGGAGGGEIESQDGAIDLGIVAPTAPKGAHGKDADKKVGDQKPRGSM